MTTNLKKDQKNGTVKTATAPSVKAPIAKQQAPKQQEPAKVTLEDRIQKVDELRSLTLKRQRTLNTLHNLRTFNFASDDNCMLELIDSQGHKFQTNNTNLITLLKDYFVTLLNDKVSALDDEIMDFSL